MENKQNQEEYVLESTQEQGLSFNEKLQLAHNVEQSLNDFIVERDKISSLLFTKGTKDAEKKFIEAKEKFVESVGDLYLFVLKLRSINENDLANLLWNEFPNLYNQGLQKQEMLKKQKNVSKNNSVKIGGKSDDSDLLTVGVASLTVAALINSEELTPVEEMVPQEEEPAFSGDGGESGGAGASGDY